MLFIAESLMEGYFKSNVEADKTDVLPKSEMSDVKKSSFGTEQSKDGEVSVYFFSLFFVGDVTIKEIGEVKSSPCEHTNILLDDGNDHLFTEANLSETKIVFDDDDELFLNLE